MNSARGLKRGRTAVETVRAGTRFRARILALLACTLPALAAGAGTASAGGPVGSLVALSALPGARAQAGAATLSDGRVLVVGGLDAAASWLASAELYDPSSDSWSAAPALGTARVLPAVASLPGDRALVAGGAGAGLDPASAEIYDGKTNTWSAAAAMPVARAGAAAATLPGGQVIVVGGYDPATYQKLASTEIYDPVADTWTPGPTLASPVMEATAATLGNGRVLVAGGVDASGVATSAAWSYAPGQGGWAAEGNLGTARFGASAAALPDGRVVVIGGFSAAGTPLASGEVYDALPGLFAPVAALPQAAGWPVAAPLADGQVLIAGGAEALVPWTPQAAVETLDPPPMLSAGAVLHPSISGDNAVGQTLSANVLNRVQLQLQWQRCTATCVDVGAPVTTTAFSARRPTYTLTAADLGARIQFVATTINPTPVESAVSPLTDQIREPGYLFAPSALTSPYLSSSARRPTSTIMVLRDDASSAGFVHYELWSPSPAADQLYPPVTGVVSFPAGVHAAMINVPISHNGVPILSDAVRVQLFSPSDGQIVAPDQLTLSLWPDLSPASYVRDPANPLELPAPPPSGEPLAGARFFANIRAGIAGQAAEALARSQPAAASMLATIALQPSTERFGAWDGPYPGAAVAAFLARVDQQEPGTVPMLSTYQIVNGQCRRAADSAAEQAAYHAWITSLAEGIGLHPAVLFLEMDSLITTPCLSPQRLAMRLAELRDAVAVLANDPHLVVYLDAGAADALSAARAASLLRQAGVADTQGFYLNSTHFDWTRREIAYGERISRLTGGKHFVVNTAENGQGPLVPKNRAKNGNEVLCDPPGRGLGPLPTSDTGYPNVDAFAWIANPGVSGGTCRPGAPATGVFWPALAADLVRHADFRVR